MYMNHIKYHEDGSIDFRATQKALIKPMPELKQYDIVAVTRDEADELNFKSKEAEPYTSIQEVVFKFRHLDWSRLDDTLLVYYLHGLLVGNVYMITDDLKVQWLGFTYNDTIEFLRNYKRFEWYPYRLAYTIYELREFFGPFIRDLKRP